MADPTTGTVLGRYRIEQRLGQGGMGVVYRAFDTVLDRQVAIKLLSGSPKEDSQLLLKEARAASALKHPHICTIYEVAELHDQRFIVMEHVEGRPLSELLASGPLPAVEAVRYASEVADGLAHAHQHGVVHCDLKSSNVVITSEGHAKLLDFGLARRGRGAEMAAGRGATTDDHHSALIAGTLHYLAPEVLRGKTSDERSDIWGLGVVLYEMLSGHLPFEGETALELGAAILRDAPRPLPPRNDPGLGSIVLRCLNKHPSRRYQRAAELKAALDVLQAAPPMARATRPRVRTIALAGGMASVVLLAWMLSRPQRIDAVAVLPMSTKATQQETTALSDGIAQSLIRRLSQLPDTKVISWTSVTTYAGRPVDAKTVAREQGVEAVVFGRLADDGDSHSLSVELVRGSDNVLLWGKTYRGDRESLLLLSDTIASDVSQQMQPDLTAAELSRLARPATLNAQALRDYTMGRHHWNQRTYAGLMQSIEYFQRAIEADPGFALAHAGLADGYLMLSSVSIEVLSPHEAMSRARPAALRALELDDSLAEGHASMAEILHNYDWDWAGAEREFRAAIARNPSYAEAHHWYAHYLMKVGRTEESLKQSLLALSLAPSSISINNGVARNYYLAGQFDAAFAQAQRTLQLDPTYIGARAILGMVYEQRQQYAEAEQEFLKIQKAVDAAATLSAGGDKEVSGDFPFVRALLGHLFAVSGRRTEALEEIARLEEMGKKRYVPAFYVAAIYAGLRESDRAVDWLARSAEERSEWVTYIEIEPVLQPLRGHPRFRRLVERIRR